MHVPGSSAASFEQVLVSYVSMLVREMFLRVFFIRTFVLDELLKQTRQLVVTYESNPNNIAEIRYTISTAYILCSLESIYPNKLMLRLNVLQEQAERGKS